MSHVFFSLLLYEKMDDIHNLVVCQYCKQVYKSPVILTCSNTICKQHVADLLIEKQGNKIKCYFCQKEHEIPENGFIAERHIEQLIGHSLDKLNFGETHQKALHSCEKFRKSLQNLDNLKNRPHAYLDRYFTNLKNRIDERRVTLKASIDSIANRMIHELNASEDECKANATSTSATTQRSISDTHAYNAKLDDWKTVLNSFQIDPNRWNSIRNEADTSCLKINEQLKKIEKELLMSQSFRLDMVPLERISIAEDLFGQLKISRPIPPLSFVGLVYHSCCLKTYHLICCYSR